MKLSIIIPVYNEERFIEDILRLVLSSCRNLPTEIAQTEIIVVDDGSTDNTPDLIRKMIEEVKTIQFFSHPYNLGKCAALALGIKRSSGDIVLIQDADLEYDPHDYRELLSTFIKGELDVVFGSRFLKPNNQFKSSSYWANRLLTLLSNLMNDLNLTDMETCYKIFRGDLIRGVKLESKRFGFEPEITAKLAKIKKLKIMEVPISYCGRDHSEGKKIGWRDGVAAIWYIFKFNTLP